MKTGEAGVELHAFLTSALDGDEWSASCSNYFTSRERAAGLDRRVGEPQWLSGCGDEGKGNPCPCWESKLHLSSPQPSHYTDWATVASFIL